jgi:hypothetical protein
MIYLFKSTKTLADYFSLIHLNMKIILLAAGFSMFLCFCNTKAKQQGGGVINTASIITDTVNYNTQVMPLLQKKCSPCHFPGGKMYAKMPFDKSTTIISHEAGVLKRFSDEKELALVKQFIHQSFAVPLQKND